MAIMTAPIEQVSSGIKKSIEQASLDLIMQNMQKNQYTKPIKSAIREVVSNALDSLNEKDVARKILTGQAKVEDYYENKEGELYADSHFDPSYYDLNWLATDRQIEVRYVVADNMEKDHVQIRDNGVGLGRHRLRKYFNLGYSTKRLSTVGLGKFGIGAKSPLAAAKYYILESRYNGLLFRFNVYNASVESIVPRFNMETEQENILVDLGEGVQVYALPTTEKNGVTVSFETKKHHKSEYIEAVKSQLMYFEDVRLVVEENGNEHVIPYKATILYEDDYLLISDNSYYSKPHILLNRVNYGYVDFKELEIEELGGNVGIKVAPEQVDVNPSRETLIWEDNTKETILRRLKEAQGSANKALDKEINLDEDFLTFMDKMSRIFQNVEGNSSVLGTFRKLLGNGFRFEIKYRYKNKLESVSACSWYGGHDEIQYFRKYSVTLGKSEKTNNPKIQYNHTRQTLAGFQDPVVVAKGKLSPRKTRYLLTKYPTFTLIRYPKALRTELEETEVDESSIVSDVKIFDAFKFWLESSPGAIWYEDVEVPEDFKYTESTKEEEEKTEEEQEEEKLSHEERRKLKGQILLYTPQPCFDHPTSEQSRFMKLNVPLTAGRKIIPTSDFSPKKTRDGQEYLESKILSWGAVETPMADLDTWNKEDTYYGTDADAPLLQLVALLTRNPNSVDLQEETRPNGAYKYNFEFKEDLSKYGKVNDWSAFYMPWFFTPKSVRLFKVAQSRVKLVKDFKHISKFFLEIISNKVTMSTRLIRWNTARKLKERLHELNFLVNLPSTPATDKYKETYRKLSDYVKAHYNDLTTLDFCNPLQHSDAMADVVSHLDRVESFQRFVAEGNSAEDIAALASHLWGKADLQDGCSVDLDLLQEYEDILDWASPVQTLLNMVPKLTGDLPTPFNPRTAAKVSSLNEEENDSVFWVLRTKSLIS